MEIRDYVTASGKDVIREYISSLPKDEKLKVIKDIRSVQRDGLEGFTYLKTRQLFGKLWEIKSSRTRIMYVIKSGDCVYFLHICKKQSQKTRKNDLDIAIRRAKKCGLL